MKFEFVVMNTVIAFRITLEYHTLRNLGVLVMDVLDAVVHFEPLEWFLCPWQLPILESN
jgi:hypothetical protein